MKFTLFDVMYDEPVSIDELESQIEMLNVSVKEYKLVYNIPLYSENVYMYIVCKLHTIMVHTLFSVDL